MKYLKQMCCFLIVVLVIVTGFCATISSVAYAEETSAPADPSAVATSPVVSDSNLASLEAQAAATGIGVRTVNGVKVFHTRDGQDLQMVKSCGGNDDVLDQDGEGMSLKTALQWQLGLPISTEVYRNIPEDSDQQITSAQISITIQSPVPYSQLDSRWASVPLGSGTDSSRPNIGAEGCFVTSAAMEAATYNIHINGTTTVTPATLNAWLASNDGFDLDPSEGYYNNMKFEKMALLPGIYGVWQSKYHYTTVNAIYTTAYDMINGSYNTAVAPSMPIVLMHKTSVSEHHCAWYGTNGTNDPSKNLIIQPTLSSVSSMPSLKATFDPADNKGYSPVNGQSLMVVACRRK